jgi:hypothetical protein
MKNLVLPSLGLALAVSEGLLFVVPDLLSDMHKLLL